MTNAITIRDTENFTGDLWDFFESVPLGNSDFQIREFVLSHCKNGRQYRQIVLQVKEDAINIKKERVERKKEEAEATKKQIEIKRLKARLAEEKDNDERDIMQAGIDILESEVELLWVNLKNRDALVKDAMRRIQVTIDCLKETGMYKREEFEAEEHEYWKTRLLREADTEMLQSGSVSKGVLQSLDKIGLKAAEVVFNVKRVALKNLKQLEAAAGQQDKPKEK